MTKTTIISGQVTSATNITRRYKVCMLTEEDGTYIYRVYINIKNGEYKSAYHMDYTEIGTAIEYVTCGLQDYCAGYETQDRLLKLGMVKRVRG